MAAIVMAWMAEMRYIAWTARMIRRGRRNRSGQEVCVGIDGHMERESEGCGCLRRGGRAANMVGGLG